jgi:NADH-quinone oxidoreductase subunit E
MIRIQKPTNSFEFSKENQKNVLEIIKRYPEDRSASAVMPLLDLAQRQSGGWIPPEAIEHIAETLGMPSIRVYEVASFYSMYNLKPVGKYLIQMCTTTPCWLRGADDVVEACKKHLNINIGETTSDGLFTLVEVECLGACINAPMAQINDDYVENLDATNVIDVLDRLKGEANAKA